MKLSLFDYIKWHCKLFISSVLTLSVGLGGSTHAPLTPINTSNSLYPPMITYSLGELPPLSCSWCRRAELFQMREM